MRRIGIASVFNRMHIGGDENRVLSFARALDRQRFDYRVILLVDPTAEEEAAAGPMLEKFRGYGIPVLELRETPRSARARQALPLRALRDARDFCRVSGRLARCFRKHGIQVVDTRSVHTILLSAVAARLAGVPAVMATEYFLDEWKKGIGPLLRRHLFRLVDALITDSRVRARDFAAWYPHSRGRVHMVPNGIYPPTGFSSREEARETLGIPGDPRVRVLTQISRLIPYKGHKVLLQAARVILDEVPDAFFVLCGYPARFHDYERELLKLAGELGIRERVRIGGYPGPIGDVWAATDVHLHASLYDSSPIAVIEGMALGLPVVATRVGDIPEMVLDGVSGLLVQPGDADALAAAAVRLLADSELALRLGSAARARYASFHRPEIMARRLEAVMLDILRRKAGPGPSRLASPGREAGP
jgi:glycosyltransferase involved in cell wall biosynthesis